MRSDFGGFFLSCDPAQPTGPVATLHLHFLRLDSVLDTSPDPVTPSWPGTCTCLQSANPFLTLLSAAVARCAPKASVETILASDSEATRAAGLCLTAGFIMKPKIAGHGDACL